MSLTRPSSWTTGSTFNIAELKSNFYSLRLRKLMQSFFRILIPKVLVLLWIPLTVGVAARRLYWGGGGILGINCHMKYM
jgi:hypothetical protein